MGKVTKKTGSSKSEKKKNRKKRKRKTWLDDEKDSAISEVQRLAQRFNTKKKKKTLEEELAEYEATCSSSLHNGTAIQTNKPYRIQFEHDVVPMIWACALCGKGYAYENLGDLFGPYYIHSPRRHPDYLCITEGKKKSRAAKCELWFHADCLLWAPSVYLHKTKLTSLEEKMYKFWDQKCEVCHNLGASVEIGSNFVHFPCANNNSQYKLDMEKFLCERVIEPGSPEL